VSATKAFLLLIEASLQSQPGEWSAGQFNIVNAQRHVSIWIANAAYGIELRVDGAEMSLPFGWKRRLRRAVDTCLARQVVERFKAQAA
jgi:hypothetical protein